MKRGSPRKIAGSDPGSHRPRRVWLIAFLVTLFPSTLWALANPLFGVPDEPSHITRAVSLVNGELLGREPEAGELPATYQYVRGVIRYVEVPLLLDRAGDFDQTFGQRIPCFTFDPDRHAGCLVYGPPTEAVGEVPTTAGEHPPVWYGVVGIPGLVSVGPPGILAMRIVNAAMTSALLAMAITAAAWLGKGMWGVGLTLALTPMLFFLGGGVNSSGPEVAAAIALWIGLPAVLSDTPPSWVVAVAGAGAVSLATIRRPGPVWVVLIALLGLIAAGSRSRVRELMRRRDVRWWGALVALAMMFQVGWLVVVSGAIDSTGGPRPTLLQVVSESWAHAHEKLVKEVVGVFGWLDTPAPALTLSLWLLALGGLLALALSERSLRITRTTGLVIVLGLLTYLGFEYLEADRFGFWQGRYSMPLLVGVPILLGLAVDTSRIRVMGPRFRWIVGVALSLAHLAAFWHYLKRNTVGLAGTDRFLFDYDWAPPLPPLVLLIAYAASVGLLTWWLVLTGDHAAEGVPSGP